MFLLPKFLTSHKMHFFTYYLENIFYVEECILVKKLLCLFILLTFLLSYTSVFASDSLYVWSSDVETSTVPTSTVINAQNDNSLNLTCGSAVLIEQNTGIVLYDHNMHEQLRPASVTKVMTILLIMEAIDNGSISLQDNVPCSENASSMGGSQIWLDPTETLTVDEMLKAICVVSANDCCVAMAEYIAGSQELFVEKMNARAKELGMNDTTFKNCHGLDEDGHVTSSYDIALMSRELITKHPSITNYTTIWMDTLRDGKSQLVNTNKLLRNYQGCTGLKTGSTSTALFNLSATATRDNLSLIAVVMKGETSQIRFAEAQKLLDYGFSNFEYYSCANTGDILKDILVQKGTVKTVTVGFKHETGVLIPKGQRSNITTTVILPDSVPAPINRGDKLGEVVFKLGDETLSTIDLISTSTIKKISFPNMLTHVFSKWFNLLR